MGKINLLSTQVAHLIAAGEVVERPVSVVKELVENALDAGATKVTVEIKGGGVSFLSVSDNGGGILREDVPLCLKRHATSKIKEKDDLYNIHTLGFRGEALAAISSVCRLTILTCSREEPVGTCAQFEGGRQVSLEDAGCPVGTTMIVRDLFYNTPARMKFLKKDNTEAGHISDMMERLALSNPGVAFQFIRDGRVSLQTSGNGKIGDCIYGIYGKDFYRGLAPVEYEYRGIHIKGYISVPAYAKPNRNFQSFFLNGRYVKAKTLMFGLEEAYKDSIMTKRYPACVLYITAAPELFDVNVHPAKTEIKFAREKEAYEAIYYACKTALMDDHTKVTGERAMKQPVYVKAGEKDVAVKMSRPAAAAPTPEKSQQVLEFISSFRERAKTYEQEAQQLRQQGRQEQTLHSSSAFGGLDVPYQPPKPLVQRQETTKGQQEPKEDLWSFWGEEPLQAEAASKTEAAAAEATVSGVETVPQEEVIPKIEIDSSIEPSAEMEETSGREPAPELQRTQAEEGEAQEEPSAPTEQPQKEPTFGPDWRLAGEVFSTYLIVEQGDKVYLIDKHAAHERVLYEELKAQAREHHGQLLLSPQPVTLGRREIGVVLDHLDTYEHLGFVVESFGDNTLLVRQVPLGMEQEDIAAMVEEIAQQLLENKHQVGLELEDHILHTMACKAAIKANQKNSQPELQWLVDRLMSGGDIKYCPHGRPVCIEMSKYSIEKQFGRIV